MNVSEHLIKAAKGGNLKEVRKLLSKGALFTKDEFGNTALHEAAWTGNNDIVKILLKAYCFVDSVNGAGFTPLHLACQNGHAKVAKTLLKWKANASLKNQHEETPIHLVAKYDHSHLVPVLAAGKVDLDVKAKDGNTALHIAAKLGYIATVKALIQNGANPNYTNAKSKLPIDYAEFGDYHDTVKVLIPVTERPMTTSRRATIDSVTRPKTPDLETGRSGKKSFFKNKSPKSPKDAKFNKKKYDSPQSLREVDFRMRQRSATTVSPATRRYSREFEDLPPKLYSYSSSVSADSPLTISRGSRQSNRSTGSPSLEDLLEEIEKETHGPTYKYIPPASDDSEDNASVTYKPLRCIPTNPVPSEPSPTSPNQIGGLPVNMSMPNLAAGSQHARHSPSPLIRSPSTPKYPIYDFLTPRGTKCALDNEEPKETTTTKELEETKEPEDEEDSYVRLRPPIESDKRTSPDGQDSSFYSHPVLSDEVLHHHYEYLSPLKDEAAEDDSYESYVYMAPRKDYPQRPQNVSPLPKTPTTRRDGLHFPDNPSTSYLPGGHSSPNRSPRKAVVCDVPVRENNVHNPADNTRVPKSILTQCSEPNLGEKRNSQLEKYLDDELDTIRQAFQIRLSQIEKRYQRQLASMSSKNDLQRTKINSYVEPNSLLTNQGHMRRASWHGNLELCEREQSIDDTLSTGFESGSEESLLSSVADSSCYNEGTETPKPDNKNIDDIDELHKPRLADFMPTENEAASLSGDAKDLIQSRIQEYKSRMMEYLMERAELQITNMEKKFDEKFKILQRQQSMQPSHISHTPSETFV